MFGGGPSPLADPETLARAKELLLLGRSIDLVAEQIGFARADSFAWAFLREVGIRPGAWRTANGGVLRPRICGVCRAPPRRRRLHRPDDKPMPRYKR